MRFSGKTASGLVGAAVIAMATPFIGGWEGKRNYAYLDNIAKPPVWTVCYGQTGPLAYEGAYYTDGQCLDMLKRSVADYYASMQSCMSRKDVPVSVQASLLELGYNIGSGALCKSTAMRKANSGDYAGACDAVTSWVKAGGVTVKGLVNRRNASKEMCMKDVRS